MWIVSDGSTDNTNNIIKKFLYNKKLNFLPLERSGKSQAINKAISHLNGDIIIFSDANIEYTSKTISNLLKPFSEDKVGCSCGKLVFRNPGKIISGKESLFIGNMKIT